MEQLARVFPAASIAGLHISHDMLSRAARRLRPYGERIQLVEGHTVMARLPSSRLILWFAPIAFP